MSKKREVKIPSERDWLNPLESWDTGWYKLTTSYNETIYSEKERKKHTPSSYHPELKDYRELDISFTLSDCSRQITLDFNATDEKFAKERLVKVRKLIKILRKIETLLERFVDNDF